MLDFNGIDDGLHVSSGGSLSASSLVIRGAGLGPCKLTLACMKAHNGFKVVS